MKQLVVLMAIVFVLVLAVSCGSTPASGRPDALASPSTATLWTPNAAGTPGQVLDMLGSGFPPSTTVELYIAGDLWATVSTSKAGTFMAMQEAPSLPVEVVYAIEAFVGDELWATHPYATGQ